MTLLLFKLFATPALILLATLVSRRFGPAIGGWLVGHFGFVGFFVTVALLVTRVGLWGAFAAALAVNLAIHCVAYFAMHVRFR